MTAHSDPTVLLSSTRAINARHPGRGWSIACLLLAALAVMGIAIMAALIRGTATELRMTVLGCGVLLGLRITSGLLPGFGLDHEARLRRNVLTWLGALAITLVSALVLISPGASELAGFAWIFIAVGLGVPLANRLVRAFLSFLNLWGEPVYLAGTAESVRALEQWLHAHPALGLRPDNDPTTAKVLWADRGLPDPKQLALLERHHSDIVIVHDLPRLPLSGIHPSRQDGNIGLRLVVPRRYRLSGVVKRVIDLAVALPLALMALPVIFLAAICIRIVDPGPAFYTQTRDGLNGRPFGLLKLRSMYLDSDRLLAELIARDAAAREEWETHYKLRHDPRILPVIGNLLRRSSLDELPQLLNVLRGEMSLIGPRPFPAYHLDAMPPSFRAHRATVMPGLTGLCQISARGSADLEAQQQLDEYYIAGRTLWGDLSIFLRTFGAVFGRGGAF